MKTEDKMPSSHGGKIKNPATAATVTGKAQKVTAPSYRSAPPPARLLRRWRVDRNLLVEVLA